MSQRGLLLVAHGSRRLEANDEVRHLAERLGGRVHSSFTLIGHAFLELVEPDISNGLRALIERGADDIVILPYFLTEGRHVAEDIPDIVDTARTEYPAVRFQLKPYLGTSDALIELLACGANECADKPALPPRQSYVGEPLRRALLAADPIVQFGNWFTEACESDQPEPNAMVLATVDDRQRPSQRTVLLKLFDEHGLVFFTNYKSRKAREISANAEVSLSFPWYRLRRQVIVSGQAKKVSTTESLRYFITRPHGSQLGAWVSRQSEVISTRTLLEAKYDEIRRRFADGKVPLPSFWGGFRVHPERFEFWQGQPDRLHDRFQYQRQDSGWRIDRLAP